MTRMRRVVDVAFLFTTVLVLGCSAGQMATTPVRSVPATGQAKYVYVVQPRSATAGSSVLQLSAQANGSTAPLSALTVSGANATSVFVDTSGDIWVAGVPCCAVINTGTVQMYTAGASGTSLPTRAVSGAAESNNYMSAQSFWVDSSGQLFIAGLTDSVSVYASGATTPNRFIQGSLTGLTAPTALVVDGLANIYVANNDAASPSILVFSATANGNAAPVRTITSATGTLAGMTGLALDSAGNLYVSLNQGGVASVEVFPSTASGATSAARTIAGAATGLGTAVGLNVDGAGYLYVLNEATANGTSTPDVLVFAPGATGNASPAQQLTSTAWTAASGQIGLE